jgi:UDP-N-acetylglucosamine 2-epimerase (non-hydrolysing)
MKVAVVLGTRPEIIKFAPIIRELIQTNTDFFIIHTGQHYSHNMDGIFFEELRLPAPKYNLNVGSGTHSDMTAKMLTSINDILLKETPDVILVLGDTNTVLAGTLAATKLKIKIGHVEAGLRSRDWRQPEEKNRIISDHISDFLFTPTTKTFENLNGEGLPRTNIQKLWITGNTIVDAVQQNLNLGNKDILTKLDIKPKNYFLVTMHREEYVDVREKLVDTLEGLDQVYEKYKIPIIFPIHPRTRKRLVDFGLQVPKGLKLIDPLGYLEFLQVESNASLILTDSGGIQEEACILGVPCVVLREFTDRAETVDCGATELAGTDAGKIITATAKLLDSRRKWTNPLGDGKTGERIVKILHEELAKPTLSVL